jgi:hypothetical protein
MAQVYATPRPDSRRERRFRPKIAQGLQALGWAVGRNVQIESRFDAADAEHIRNAGDRNFPCIES